MSVFPDNLKLAEVIPNFKRKDDLQSFAKYFETSVSPNFAFTAIETKRDYYL